MSLQGHKNDETGAIGTPYLFFDDTDVSGGQTYLEQAALGETNIFWLFK